MDFLAKPSIRLPFQSCEITAIEAVEHHRCITVDLKTTHPFKKEQGHDNTTRKTWNPKRLKPALLDNHMPNKDPKTRQKQTKRGWQETNQAVEIATKPVS